MKVHVTSLSYLPVSTGVKLYKKNMYEFVKVLNNTTEGWEMYGGDTLGLSLFSFRLTLYNMTWKQTLAPSFEVRALRLCPSHYSYYDFKDIKADTLARTHVLLGTKR